MFVAPQHILCLFHLCVRPVGRCNHFVDPAPFLIQLLIFLFLFLLLVKLNSAFQNKKKKSGQSQLINDLTQRAMAIFTQGQVGFLSPLKCEVIIKKTKQKKTWTIKSSI